MYFTNWSKKYKMAKNEDQNYLLQLTWESQDGREYHHLIPLEPFYSSRPAIIGSVEAENPRICAAPVPTIKNRTHFVQEK
jgi:hypothetical protein